MRFFFTIGPYFQHFAVAARSLRGRRSGVTVILRGTLYSYSCLTIIAAIPSQGHVWNMLYWLLRLDRRPAAEDYLLCHTGTLALRVHVVMPGRLHDTFSCCVCIDNSIVMCIAQFIPPETDLASRWRITKR